MEAPSCWLSCFSSGWGGEMKGLEGERKGGVNGQEKKGRDEGRRRGKERKEAGHREEAGES